MGKPKKTWGREIATALLIWFCLMCMEQGVEFAEVMAYPVLTTWLAVFGLKRITGETNILNRK